MSSTATQYSPTAAKDRDEPERLPPLSLAHMSIGRLAAFYCALQSANAAMTAAENEPRAACDPQSPHDALDALYDYTQDLMTAVAEQIAALPFDSRKSESGSRSQVLVLEAMRSGGWPAVANAAIRAMEEELHG